MGLFTKLFKRTKEVPCQEVTMANLALWYKEQTAAKVQSIKGTIHALFAQIQIEVEQANTALTALEHATLRNEHIPVKARQVMEGNRRSYLNQAHLFLNTLNSPSEINFKNVQTFVQDFEEKLAKFTQSSARSFYVLQEFFKDESGSVAKYIKRIDETMRQLLDNEYKEIIEVSEAIVKLHSLLKKNEETTLSLKEEQEKLQSLMDLMERNNTEISGLKASKQFTNVEERKQHLLREEKILKNIQDDIVQLFSPLLSSMKRYARITMEHEKLLQSYLDDPVQALQQDQELSIVEALQKMQQAMENQEVEMREEKLQKAQEQLQSISKEKLAILRKSLTQQQQSVQELRKSVQTDATLARIEELEFRNQHLQGKAIKVEEAIQQREKNMVTEELMQVKGDIAEKIKNVLSMEVKIRESS